MELREISDSIYHGKSTEKKKEMNAVYYESAEFIKNNFPQKYQEMLQEAERIAYQIGAEEAAEIVQKMRPHGQKWTREEIAAYLKENGFWESDTAVDESAKVADVYFTNEEDETVSFVTVYSKMERAEDGSWDTEIEKEYWEEL